MKRFKNESSLELNLKNPKVILVCFVLIILTLGIYGQTINHRFSNFDVPVYVTENRTVQNGLTWPSVRWALTTFHSAEWMPVTWLSYLFDYEMYGLDSGAFHLSNVLFHLISVVLLFLVLADLTGSLYGAAVVAALFTVHPLRVESVVWIAERKDVLSMLFFLLTLKAYEAFIKNPHKKAYGIMLTFFALGLMSKAMLITAPFLFLLLDYWPFARFQTKQNFFVLLREKLPMIAMAGISGILNYKAVASAGGIVSFETLSFMDRTQNALVCYCRYLKKTFWPVNLAHFYPYQKQYLTSFAVIASLVILIAITLAAWKLRRNKPAVLVGWLWFLGALFPVIGIVQAGTQSMADRYTYIPHIGLIWAIVWGVSMLLDRWKISLRVRIGALMVVMVPLFVLSWRQTGYWQNALKLNAHAMSVTEANYIAHENMAFALAKRKRLEEAEQHYQAALQIEPNRVRNLYNLGLLALNQMRYSEARRYFLEVLAARPGNLDALNGLGVAAMKTRQFAEATKYFMDALTYNPDYIPARKGLTYVYIQNRQIQEARFHLDFLMKRADEKDPEVLVLRGFLAVLERKEEEAIAIYKSILESRPRNIDALLALGNLYLNLKDLPKAISYYERALQVDMALSEVHKNLGIALGRLGETERAEQHFKKALELKPNSARVHYRWGRMLVRQNKKKEAAYHFQEAKRLNPNTPGLEASLQDLWGQSPEIKGELTAPSTML